MSVFFCRAWVVVEIRPGRPPNRRRFILTLTLTLILISIPVLSTSTIPSLRIPALQAKASPKRSTRNRTNEFRAAALAVRRGEYAVSGVD